MRHSTDRHIARGVPARLACGVFLAGAATAPALARPAQSLYGAMTPPDPAIGRCVIHYAGHCPLSYPCYHYRLSEWRFGDQRDFECFILRQN